MGRTHESIENELLVLRAQDGEVDALRRLVSRWHRRITGWAWRLTSQREAALDVAQDTWLAIVRGLKRLDDPARFPGWVYGIVTHKCADWTRRQQAQRRIGGASLGAGVVATVAASAGIDDDVARVRWALAALLPGDRLLLSLYYLESMSVGQVALVVGVPAGTIKSRLFHARNRLKQALERATT